MDEVQSRDPVVGPVIKMFRTSREAAAFLGVKPSNISNWRRDGYIPEKHHFKIFQLAHSHGVELPKTVFTTPERAA